MVDVITHQALVYQAANRGHFRFAFKRTFLNDLSLHIYAYPGLHRVLREEDWSEFLLSFLGRVPDILMRYEFRGPSFISYLNSFLDWHLKTFYRSGERFRRECWVYERESALSCSCCTDGSCPMDCEMKDSLAEKLETIFSQAGVPRLRKEVLRQRLLVLVLKNAAVLDEDDYLTAFPLLGPSSEEALRMKRVLLKTLAPRMQRKQELSLKRNEAYFRLDSDG